MSRIAIAAAFIALAWPGSAVASCGGQLRPITVTSGAWGGTPWRLQAVDSGDGRFAMSVVVAGSRRVAVSGRLGIPAGSGATVELLWRSSGYGAKPTFIAGAAAETARTVTFGLSNGAIRTARTIPPRCLLQPDISFFVVTIPYGTRPTFLTARNAAGAIIAHWQR